MCFVKDYDWNAEVQEQSVRTATKPTRCDECRRDIPTGALVHHLFQQEHEECQECRDGLCECPKDEDEDCLGCKCAEPAYGETFDWDCCEDCWKFLTAIERAELNAGCSRYDARPYLCQMIESISDGGMDEAKRYWKQAAQDFPELRSGYLGWLWRKTFPLEGGVR